MNYNKTIENIMTADIEPDVPSFEEYQEMYPFDSIKDYEIYCEMILSDEPMYD